MGKKLSFELLLQLEESEKDVLPPFPYILFLNTFFQMKIPTLFLHNLNYFFLSLIPRNAIYDL